MLGAPLDRLWSQVEATTERLDRLNALMAPIQHLFESLSSGTAAKESPDRRAALQRIANSAARRKLFKDAGDLFRDAQKLNADMLKSGDDIPLELQCQIYYQRERMHKTVRDLRYVQDTLSGQPRTFFVRSFFRLPRETILWIRIMREVRKSLGEIIETVSKEESENFERWKRLVARNPSFAAASNIEKLDRSRGVRVDWETLRAKTSN